MDTPNDRSSAPKPQYPCNLFPGRVKMGQKCIFTTTTIVVPNTTGTKMEVQTAIADCIAMQCKFWNEEKKECKFVLAVSQQIDSRFEKLLQFMFDSLPNIEKIIMDSHIDSPIPGCTLDDTQKEKLKLKLKDSNVQLV